MGNGVDGDDRFNLSPERIREIVGEGEEPERIVAGARMMMSQRADNALAGLVDKRETPKVPALVITSMEEFFVALAKRRSDQTMGRTAMPRRIEFGQGFRPDLSRASLSRLDLRNINFDNALLEGAVLQGCNLSGSSFDYANMDGADLTWAICRGVGFAHASFDGTTLTDADCTGADFYEARFIESHLRGTNFSGADMKDVVFVGAVEARGANIFGARFDPTLEIGEDETITSATEIELRLGFVRVDTKMASRTEEVDVILR